MTPVRLTVARASRVTPLMVRVTLAGDDLVTYESSGEPDESCAVLFPARAGGVTRFYTVRRLDRTRGEIDLDLVEHGRGPAARWAGSARAGEQLVLGSARGTFTFGPERHLIVGDATALPAIGRILAEAPRPTAITTVVVVRDRDEEQPLGTADAELHWVHAPTPELVPDALESAVRGLGRLDGTRLWAAGEASGVRRIRSYLRDELQRPRRRDQVLGYWRLDVQGWERRYAAVRAELEHKITAARRSATDEEDFLDAVERIYLDAGL